jgi:hypothetical protein
MLCAGIARPEMMATRPRTGLQASKASLGFVSLIWPSSMDRFGAVWRDLSHLSVLTLAGALRRMTEVRVVTGGSYQVKRR